MGRSLVMTIIVWYGYDFRDTLHYIFAAVVKPGFHLVCLVIKFYLFRWRVTDYHDLLRINNLLSMYVIKIIFI